MIWKANGTDFTELGISIAAGSFRAHGASILQLEADVPFDVTPLFTYNEAVVITYEDEIGGGDTYFQGRCVSIPRYGSGSGEGQYYEIADAWEQLERTIYQEKWGYSVASGSTYVLDTDENRTVPRSVFGLDEDGDPIQIGEIITNAIEFAATAGVNIAAGSIPTGEYPFHVEMTNVSVAEIIRTALRLHPDWVPWIDHSATPPALHITPISAMTAVSYPVDGSGDNGITFDIQERLDLMPDSVRICYEWADEAMSPGAVDPDVDPPDIYRKITIDKYPLGSPASGPGCIITHIPLQGLTEQRQKARLWCRTIPVVPSLVEPEPREIAKDWFKAKYPHMAAVPNEEFEVIGFDRAMIMEWEGLPEDPKPAKDPPPPINPRATRIDLTDDITKYPRELYKGQIEDWMRVRVGRMEIKNVKIVAAPGAAPATRDAIRKGFPSFTIIATNARTKRYSGPAQWTPGDNIPEGVAQAIYQSIRAANRWQGSVTIDSDEVPLSRLVGKKLNLTGSSVTGWDTMGAPIHSVSWDIQSGRATVEIGPSPYLAPTDFLELQRILRSLPVQWWAKEERDNTRSQYGSESGASAAGDSVGGFDFPETIFEQPDVLPVPLHIIDARPAYIPEPEDGPAEGAQRFWVEWGTLNDKLATNWDSHYDITATTYFFAKPTLRTTDTLLITSWEIVTGSAEDSHVTADWQVGEDRPSTAAHLLGRVTVTGANHTIENSGGGSLILTEHLTNIEGGTGAGDVIYGKQLIFNRQNY
jgi:hypothetical protein